VRQESLNGRPSIEFLIPWLRVAGKRLWGIGEGSPLPRRTGVRDFGSGPGGQIWPEALPGDAPDLNPGDEGGGHHLKPVQRRHLVCRDREELHEQFHLAVGRLRQSPPLIRSFFAQAGWALG
jgi:hypothetical protein